MKKFILSLVIASVTGCASTPAGKATAGGAPDRDFTADTPAVVTAVVQTLKDDKFTVQMSTITSNVVQATRDEANHSVTGMLSAVFAGYPKNPTRTSILATVESDVPGHTRVHLDVLTIETDANERPVKTLPGDPSQLDAIFAAIGKNLSNPKT